MNYDYTKIRNVCESVNINWLGDDFYMAFDHDQKSFGVTQEQIDNAMEHHVWEIKYRFSPEFYSFRDRIKMALHFLFGK